MSATVIGAALGLNEVQVWKDVDGEPPMSHSIHFSRPANIFDMLWIHLTVSVVEDVICADAQLLRGPVSICKADHMGNSDTMQTFGFHHADKV